MYLATVKIIAPLPLANPAGKKRIAKTATFAPRDFGVRQTSSKIISRSKHELLKRPLALHRRVGAIYSFNLQTVLTRRQDYKGSQRWGQDINRKNDSSGLHFKTGLFILLMVMFAPLGNVLLSKGMKRIGSAKTWGPWRRPAYSFQNPKFRLHLAGDCLLAQFFHRLHAGSHLGGLQLCSAGVLVFLCRGGHAKLFSFW